MSNKQNSEENSDEDDFENIESTTGNIDNIVDDIFDLKLFFLFSNFGENLNLTDFSENYKVLYSIGKHNLDQSQYLIRIY